MGLFPVVLAKGDAGSVVVDEADGQLTIAATGNLSLGGGDAKGIVELESSNKVKLGLHQAIDLGLVAAEHKFPSLAPAIDGLKKLIDAEMTKQA